MKVCFEQARGGDRGATEAVVTALRPRLASMAAYYARCSGEDAEDLLQEAWVGLLESLPQLDTQIGSPEQYLIQRARWRLLDAIKRARVRRCTSLDEETVERLATTPMEHALDDACLAEFVAQLKPFQQAVLHCLLAGLTWREAGRALGCTSANIAYHVRQIRRAYERWLDAPLAPAPAPAIEKVKAPFTPSRTPAPRSGCVLKTKGGGCMDTSRTPAPGVGAR